eukprot:1464619-Amphidinium_carterae.1
MDDVVNLCDITYENKSFTAWGALIRTSSRKAFIASTCTQDFARETQGLTPSLGRDMHSISGGRLHQVRWAQRYSPSLGV